MTYKSDFLRTLEERGFLYQLSDAEGLDKILCEGPVTGYIGFDATAKSLHVGNLVQIMLLYWLQKNRQQTACFDGWWHINGWRSNWQGRNAPDDDPRDH